MKTTSKSTELVIQPNVISRASYSFSTAARRLMAMAMAALPMDGSDYQAVFSVRDFENAMGVEKSGKQREDLINAVRECLDSHIELFIPLENGRVAWAGFTWFSQCFIGVPSGKLGEKISFIQKEGNEEMLNVDFNSVNSTDLIIMNFNRELGEAIREFKKTYAKLSLINFGKLRSSYAIRYYEIAMSYSGFAGKEGNPKDTWYFERTLQELRKLFIIGNDKYKLTKDFRIRIIDNPIKELNEAKIGIKIKIEYIRERKFLVGVKFICKFVEDKPKKEAQKAIEAKETPISGKREDISAEIEELRGKYPAEWEKIYEEETQKFTARMVYKESKELTSAEEKIIERLAFGRLKEHLGL